MKKIWKPVLACLLLVITILAAMYLFREDRRPDPEGYGVLERPPVTGDGPSRGGGQTMPGHPISPYAASGGQMPPFSVQPGMAGGRQEDRPVHNPNGALGPADDQPPDVHPDEGMSDSGIPEEGDDQAPPENGNSGEVSPDGPPFEE